MNILTRMLISSGLLENLSKIKREIEREIGEDLFEYSVVNTDEIRDKLLDSIKDWISEKEEIDMIVEEDLEMFQLFDIRVNIYGIEKINSDWAQEVHNTFVEDILCRELGKILANDKALLTEFVDELLEHYENNYNLGLPF